uniref:non-specific serine/threonine protein kinase n=1 Tax=Leptobrachium leishanense TaxID=445787 RepID=A0A8C5QXQ2_9ANUR
MLRRRSNSKNAHSFLFDSTQTSIKTASFYDAYLLDPTDLGRGKFAVVRKCTEKCTGRVYAAKFLKKRRRGKDSRPEIIHEIAVLELAKPCPHIVDLYEVYETGHEIILVLEYIAGGEIFNLCVPERDEAFSENQIVRLVRQIIEGVYFLHQNNIVHLDLKPQNILLSGVDSAEDVKIVDFGLSRKLSETIALREIMGTTDYVAPEILNYEPISTSTDIWSIGVICYMLLSCEAPFVGTSVQETYLNISQLNVDFSDDSFTSVSQEAIDFIKCTLVLNPRDRATAGDCLSHPWLQQAEISHCHGSILCGIQSGQAATNYKKTKTRCDCNQKNVNDQEDKENLSDCSTPCKRFRIDDAEQSV